MCIELLPCREMARQLHSSEDCCREVNGRKQGVMELTKRFWDEKGYHHLERRAQNLHDKIGHIEKSSQTVGVLIDSRDLKQTDAAAKRRWSTSKFLFRKTQGQGHSVSP